MDKRTITGIATAALITTAGISITNNVKPLNITGSGGKVEAATTQQVQQFVQKAVPAATEASSKYGTYTSVMIAQAAVESGWGQSTLAKEPNNNLFGIKGSYNGQSVSMNTSEYGSNGYYNTTEKFRKYPSYTESFNDNGALIRKQMGSYYSGAWVENADSAEEAVQNGLQGKYATAPNYAATLNSVIKANNLKQYDPKITSVNETKTVVNTTPITNAPVDSDVAKQVGTARAGQQVSISKRITYGNGVSHSLIESGWINDTAFGSSTNQTSTATKNTSTTTKPKTTTKKKKSYTTVKTNEIVKVISAPEGGAPVLKSPAGKPTGQKLALNTRWKVSGYAIVDGTRYNKVGSKQWLSTIYTDANKAVKTNSPVSQAPKVNKTTKDTTAKKTSTTTAEPAYEKASGKFEVTAANIDVWTKPGGQITGQWLPAESSWKITGKTTSNGKTWYRMSKNKWVESAGIKLDGLKTTPVSQAPSPTKTSTTTKTTEKKSTSSSSYEKISGEFEVTVSNIDVWTAPGGKITGQWLPQESSWKVTGKKTVNGETWYRMSDKKWVESAGIKLKTAPITQTPAVTKLAAKAAKKPSYTITKSKGVVTVNSKPNHGIAVWSEPGKNPTTKYLPVGTSWKFFKIAVKNGEKWYNLGGNQWVPAKYVMVR